MNDLDISHRLRAISHSEWEIIIKKCYSHVSLRMGANTKFGAHCEQRLGMPAPDFYVGNAIKAIYEQSWEWQFEKYGLTEQLIRIINSMISKEVRNYRSEKAHNKQLPLLIDTSEFEWLPDDHDDQILTAQLEKNCSEALDYACKDNELYKSLVRLKKDGKSYDEIAETLGCSKDGAYRLMENVSRKANRYMKSYN